MCPERYNLLLCLRCVKSTSYSSMLFSTCTLDNTIIKIYVLSSFLYCNLFTILLALPLPRGFQIFHFLLGFPGILRITISWWLRPRGGGYLSGSDIRNPGCIFHTKWELQLARGGPNCSRLVCYLPVRACSYSWIHIHSIFLFTPPFYVMDFLGIFHIISCQLIPGIQRLWW